MKEWLNYEQFAKIIMSILVIGQSNGFIVRQGRQSRMSSNASSTASSAPSSVDQHHAHSHSNSDSGLSSLTGIDFKHTSTKS